MLWWIIGVWLVSGAVMPLLWLLSMASRGVFARDLWAEQRQVTVGSDNAPAPASAPRSYSIRRLASSLAMRAFRVPGYQSRWYQSDAEKAPRGPIRAFRTDHPWCIDPAIRQLVLVQRFKRHNTRPAFGRCRSPRPVAPAAVAETRPLQSQASAALSPVAAALCDAGAQ